MKAFENIAIAPLQAPTAKQVLASVRRDEACRADPSSGHCTFEQGRDDYLLRDVAGTEMCLHCPIFRRKLQELTALWEEWVLAMQDVYT